MVVDVYLLVNTTGTKTKQWILVANGSAFPEVLRNREVAVRMAVLLYTVTSGVSDLGPKRREEAWKDAEKALISEIGRTISVEKNQCSQGRMWTGGEEIGFKACVRCPHLQNDRDASHNTTWGRIPPAWECGAIISGVRVARKLADR